MDGYRCRYLILVTAIIGGASSHYEKNYNGHIFILPENGRPLELALPEAKKWCTDNFPRSTLPRIIKDRDNIFEFIQSALLANRLNNGQTVLVNSIQHTRSDWLWIIGRDIGGINVKPVSQDDEVKPYNFGFLWTEREYSIQASLPTVPRYYICEYANFEICSTIVNHKCYRKKIVRTTYSQARNACLADNGDLASFETLNSTTLNYSLQNLSLDDKKDYWIGIRRSLHHLDEEGSEIKFINWTHTHRSDINARCLCLNVSKELRWIECDCQNKYPFICANKDTIDSATSVAIRRTRTFNQMTSSISPPSRPTTSTTLMIVSDSTIPRADDSNIGLNTVIGAVVSCFIIAVIIVVVIVVVNMSRKQRNRPVKTYEEKTITAATNEQTIYSDIQEPREYPTITSCSASNTTYAFIQAAPETNEEFQANNIVYAELDLPQKA